MKDIASKGRTQEILAKYQLKAKKHLGQNFLIDHNIASNIVQVAGVNKQVGVIEIGPGIGSLTQILTEQALKVVAVEIDPNMQEVLADTLQDYRNVKIIKADFLQLDLNKLLEDEFVDVDEVVVVANLPYYITTPILIKIFESDTRIKRVCAMMQKEVGQRLSAEVGTKDYNSLTILTQFYSQAKIVMKVSKNVFIPAPKVDSVVVLFDIDRERYKVADKRIFFKLLRIIFKQRRKTILNNLNECYHDKELTGEILDKAQIKPNVRAEALDIKQIIKLSDEIVKGGYADGIEKLCEN